MSDRRKDVNLRHIVMPNDTNPSNFLFGGVLLSWIDLAAAMVAERHAKMDVAAVHMEEVSFKSAIKLGDHVVINAHLISVGKTSMRVKVEFFSESPKRGEISETYSVCLTFVGIQNGKPAPVPPLDLA